MLFKVILVTFVMLENILGESHPTKNVLKTSLNNKSRKDLDASATGYVYRSDNNGPGHFYYYGNEGNIGINYYNPIAALSYYPAHDHSHSVSFEAPAPASYIYQPQTSEYIVKPDGIYNAAQSKSSIDSDEGSEERTNSKLHSGSYESGAHDDHDSSHSAEEGSKHGEEFSKKKGEKSNKSYDSKNAYSKGRKGKYDSEKHYSSEGSKGGSKKTHHDEAKNYNKHHAEGGSKKGGKHGEKKQHKKGSKSTGYHNVFHKDEYKKDHTFYDTKDHNGHFSKYGSNDKKHSEKDGSYRKGGHYDLANHEDHKFQNGEAKKGHYDENDEKHKTKKGIEKNYEDKEHHTEHGGNSHTHTRYHGMDGQF